MQQLHSGGCFDNDTYGADHIPGRGRALEAAAGKAPAELLDLISASLTTARPPRHAAQMAAVYSGELSVVQVLLGDEAPRRLWPLVWLYAEETAAVEEPTDVFFARLAAHVACDDFTEMHGAHFPGMCHCSGAVVTMLVFSAFCDLAKLRGQWLSCLPQSTKWSPSAGRSAWPASQATGGESTRPSFCTRTAARRGEPNYRTVHRTKILVYPRVRLAAGRPDRAWKVCLVKLFLSIL